MWYVIYGLRIVGIFPSNGDALDYLADCIAGRVRPEYFTKANAFALQFVPAPNGPVYKNIVDLLVPPDLSQRDVVVEAEIAQMADRDDWDWDETPCRVNLKPALFKEDWVAERGTN
jgi:hypothetical protein|tara:strand:- start:325 stop:672 length:348 start_codon:yes stop_codon:yes gene_type:complete